MTDLLSGAGALVNALITHTLAALLFIGIFAGIGVLVHAQYTKDNFDLRSLIVDPTTKQPSIHQLGQCIALAISSWALIVLVLNGRLTEAYFTIYMTVWAGANSLDHFLRSRDGGPGGPGDGCEDRSPGQ
jgi:hypothetical protein